MNTMTEDNIKELSVQLAKESMRVMITENQTLSEMDRSLTFSIAQEMGAHWERTWLTVMTSIMVSAWLNEEPQTYEQIVRRTANIISAAMAAHLNCSSKGAVEINRCRIMDPDNWPERQEAARQMAEQARDQLGIDGIED